MARTALALPSRASDSEQRNVNGKQGMTKTSGRTETFRSDWSIMRHFVSPASRLYIFRLRRADGPASVDAEQSFFER